MTRLEFLVSAVLCMAMATSAMGAEPPILPEAAAGPAQLDAVTLKTAPFKRTSSKTTGNSHLNNGSLLGELSAPQRVPSPDRPGTLPLRR